MGDLKSAKLIYLKAGLFAVILSVCTGAILYETRSFRIAFMLGLIIWSAARLYYFIFYVIEKYVDSTFRFSGIISFLQYLLSSRK